MVSAPKRASTGFTLVEVVVAIVVLAVGVLALVATVALAARTLRQAEANEAAVAIGAMVLDSLLQEPAPGAGELVDGRYRVRWTVARRADTDLIGLTVEYGDGARPRSLTLYARHAPAPPRLEGPP